MINRFFNWMFKASMLYECIEANKQIAINDFGKLGKGLIFVLFYVVQYLFYIIAMFLIFSIIYGVEIYFLDNNIQNEIEEFVNWPTYKVVLAIAGIKSIILSMLAFILFDIIIPAIYYLYKLIKLITTTLKYKYEIFKNRR